jgi:hypothetical protein
MSRRQLRWRSCLVPGGRLRYSERQPALGIFLSVFRHVTLAEYPPAQFPSVLRTQARGRIQLILIRRVHIGLGVPGSRLGQGLVY